MRWISGSPWGSPAGMVKVPEVDPADLQDALARGEDIQILDVRTGAEFRRGHIRGAVCVPIHRLQRRLPVLRLDRSKPVVAVCKTAHRSIPAVRMLARAGYHPYQLAHGMDGWRRKGLPIDRITP